MATIYISTLGNDSSGAGTVGNPYLTVTKGHAVATAGDTLSVAAGTYATPVTWTFTKNITVQGATGYSNEPTTIFDGSYIMYTVTSPITVTFNDCKFINGTGGEGAVFDLDNTTTGGAGQTLNVTRCVFRNQSIVMDTGGRGGIVCLGRGGFTPTLAVTFTNCLFDSQVVTTNQTQSGMLVGSDNNAGTIAVTFIGCTLYYPGAGAGVVPTNLMGAVNASGTYTITMKNNIWNNASGTNIAFQNNMNDTIVTSYNDYYTNWTALPTLGTGDIQSDPLFISPSTSNFLLRPTSPCVDAGVIT